MHINLALTVLFIYLLFSLAIGLYSRRGTKNFQQFAVGDKKFSIATLVTTMLATNLSGTYLGMTLAGGYTNSWYYALGATLTMLTSLFISRCVALRLGEFMQHLSIAESMGVLFGKAVRVITAIVGILLSLVGVSMQLYVISRVVKLYCNVDGNLVGYMAIGIVVLYCAFGGIKAVTFTDVIQFITFTTLIPLLIYLVGSHVPSFNSVSTILTTRIYLDIKQSISSEFGVIFNGSFFKFVWLNWILFTLTAYVEPYGMQRIYMAKHVREVRSIFFYQSIVEIMIDFSMLFLAILLLACDTTLDSQLLLRHILKMCPSVWLTSFVCIAILALAMSTADSMLHTAAVLFTHDIVTVFKQPKNKLRWAHISSLCIGVVATMLLPLGGNIFNLLSFMLNVYQSTICPSFMLAILGFRPSTKSVLLGMGAGVLTVILLHSGLKNYLPPVNKYLWALLMNLSCLVSSHYLLPKVPGTGWIGIKDKGPLTLVKQQRDRSRETLKQRLENFRFFPYLKELMPARGLTFFALGCYALITQYIQLGNYMFTQFLPICFMCLGSFVFIYPTLKDHLLKKFHTIAIYLYPMLIFTLLFLSSSYILSIQGYTKLAVQLFLTHIAVTLLLLPWYLVVLMVVVTLCLMYGLSPMGSDLISVLIAGKRPGKFLYTILFFIVVYNIILYFRNKFSHYNQKLAYLGKEKEIHQLSKLKQSQYRHHANRLAYTDSYEAIVIPQITEKLTQLTQDQNISLAIKNNIVQLIDQLAGHKKFIEEWIYNREYHLALEHKMVDIQQIINHVIHVVSTIHHLIGIIVHPYTSVLTLCGDPIHLEHLFRDSIYYVVNRFGLASSDMIYIHIKDTSIEYALSEEEVKTLPALAFVFTTQALDPSIEPVYQESLDRKVYIVPTTKTALYKQSVIRIVNAHYGCSLLDKAEAPVTCILPIVLHEIRDEVMNSVPPSPYFNFAETEASIAQETALVSLLMSKTSLSQALITDTIQFVKRCHGDQRRASGEPYYVHPMAVTALLLKETNDSAAVLAALLHDVVEDSKIFNSYIQSRYGSQVADIVAMVTHMGNSFRKKKLNKEENEKRFLKCKDIRAIQVKIADRLHNVLTLRHRPIEKQVKVVHQTLSFYLPFAESMGVVTLTKELRMLCEEILRKYEQAGQV